jgi:hypothetical protein
MILSEAVSSEALFSVQSVKKLIIYNEMKLTGKGKIRHFFEGVVLVFTRTGREESWKSLFINVLVLTVS